MSTTPIDITPDNILAVEAAVTEATRLVTAGPDVMQAFHGPFSDLAYKPFTAAIARGILASVAALRAMPLGQEPAVMTALEMVEDEVTAESWKTLHQSAFEVIFALMPEEHASCFIERFWRARGWLDRAMLREVLLSALPSDEARAIAASALPAAGGREWVPAYARIEDFAPAEELDDDVDRGIGRRVFRIPPPKPAATVTTSGHGG